MSPNLGEIRDKIEKRYAVAMGRTELASTGGRGADARGAEGHDR